MTPSSQNQHEPHYDPLWEEVENDSRKDPKIAAWLDQFVKSVGHVVMWANVVLIIAIISQVGMRYTLGWNFPKLDELQWHLYALTTMVSVSYALSTDAHVRVNVLRANFSFRVRRAIEIIGIVVLILPFCYLMIDQGFDYFQDSYRVNERSDSPTGLPARWLLKAVIPASFVLIAIAAIARLIHDIYMLVNRADPASDITGLKPLLWMMLWFVVVTFTLMGLVEAPEEKLVIAMFMSFVGLLFSGIPVAWVLSGIGVLYCGIAYLGDNGMLL